jgi:hypothetical protein
LKIHKKIKSQKKIFLFFKGSSSRMGHAIE